MAFTKIAAAGIGSTGTITLQHVVVTGSVETPVITGAASTANVRANSLVVSGVSTLGSVVATTGTFSGNVSIAGTLTYEDVTNIDSVGLITARSGVVVNTGTATTALIVNGNARITGILTIGTSSVTLDGTNNQVNVGTGVTIHHTNGVQVGGNTVHSTGLTVNQVNAIGIITASSFRGDGSQLTGIAATTNVRTNSLVVSGVSTFAAGSAGAPSISPSGNSNTGVFFPAADTVAISEGGVEALRVDSNANVGIGTVTPSTSNGSVSRNVAIAGANNVNLAFQSSTVGYGGQLEFRRFGRSGDARYAQIGGNTDGSDHGYFNFFLARASSGVSELMRLNTVSVTDRSIQGVLGVNDTAPESSAVAARFTGGGDTALPVVSIRRNNNSGGGAGNVEIGLDVNIPNTYNSAGTVYGIKCFAAHNLGSQHYAGHFTASGNPYSSGVGVYAEVRHTDSNGPGWQPAIYAYGANTGGPVNGPGGAGAIHAIVSNHVSNSPVIKCESQYSGSPTQTAIQFIRNNATVGNITFTLSATAYGTSSDYRLKENVVALQNAEQRLRQIPVHRFNFIAEPEKTVDGFIAHEVFPFVPESVTGTKDAVKEQVLKDEDGKTIFDDEGNPILESVPEYQSIDQSKLVPLLTAALQEAFEKIDSMEERIAALENL